MITLGIFLFLTTLEFILIYLKIQQMKEFGIIGPEIGKWTGLDEKYNDILEKIAYYCTIGYKNLKWIPISVLLILNILISILISLLLNCLNLIFHIF